MSAGGVLRRGRARETGVLSALVNLRASEAAGGGALSWGVPHQLCWRALSRYGDNASAARVKSLPALALDLEYPPRVHRLAFEQRTAAVHKRSRNAEFGFHSTR